MQGQKKFFFVSITRLTLKQDEKKFGGLGEHVQTVEKQHVGINYLSFMVIQARTVFAQMHFKQVISN